MLTTILKKINSLSIAVFVLFPVFAYTQTTASVNIEVIPENYSPGEQLTISLSSFNVPLDTATIEWRVDGVLVKNELGLKTIRTTAPDASKSKKVDVVVTSKNGVVEKTLTLRAETIELYVESADGYVPPWYSGRAQIAEESVVKVIAVPDSFPAIGGDTRVYTWSKNNFKDPNQSGRGRQAFVTKLSPFVNSENISVELGDTSQLINLKPRPTSISLYEYSPLVGTRFEKELVGNLSLAKEDITFEIVPWFFSTPNRNNPIISISWTVNGLPTRAQTNRSLLNIRKDTSKKGRAEIGVSVKHTDRTLQSNKATLNIDL